MLLQTIPNLLWTCFVCAHLQCLNNHYAKFEYKGMKSVCDTDNTLTQSKHSKGDVDVIMSKFNTPKYLVKRTQKYGVHVKCVNNHNGQFEYKGMKTACVTDYTNQTPSKYFGQRNVYDQHPSKLRK